MVIVGGGIAGLTAAHKLSQDPGSDVQVLEESPRAGGSLRSERREGFLLEWGPHSLIDTFPGLATLLEAVGLAPRVIRADPTAKRRFIVRDGTAREVPSSPTKLLTTDLIPLTARVRALTEPLIPRRKATEDESVHEFVRRRFGRGAANVVADAVVTGIYAGDPRTLSVTSCYPRLPEMERESRSILRAAAKTRALASLGTFSFPDGIAELTGALEARLGTRLKLGEGVASLTRVDGGWRISTTTGAELTADRVVLACPSWEAARLLAPVDAAITSLLAAIPSVPVAVVHLGFASTDLKRPPEGFGTLVPSREGGPLLGMIATSNFFPGRAPQGHVLVTALLGGARAPKIVDAGDDRIVAESLGALERLIGPKGAPKLAHVVRHARAIPQYTLGHAARLAAIERHRRHLPNLTLIGHSYRGVGVGAAVEDALRAV